MKLIERFNKLEIEHEKLKGISGPADFYDAKIIYKDTTKTRYR
jgi:hypothetical protein